LDHGFYESALASLVVFAQLIQHGLVLVSHTNAGCFHGSSVPQNALHVKGVGCLI
jgi:hypothetical protein